MSFVYRDAVTAEKLCSEYNGIKVEIKGERIHFLIQVLSESFLILVKKLRQESALKSLKVIRLY